MKWVVYSLCLVILVLWGLATTVPPQTASSDHAHRLPRVARLQLASELPANAPRGHTSAQVPAETSASSPAVNGGQSRPSVTASSQPAGPEAEGASAAPKVTSAPADAVSPDQPLTPDKPREPTGSEKTPPPACLVVAHIATEERAKSIVSAMGKAGAKGVTGSREEVLPPLNWVLTPRYDSRHAALRALRHFQRQGIDSFLVTEGKWTNAISLGIYHSGDAAHKVVRRLTARGVKARIEPYQRTQQIFFARFPALTPDQVTELRDQVQGSGDRSGAEQIIACQGVASTDKSP